MARKVLARKAVIGDVRDRMAEIMRNKAATFSSPSDGRQFELYAVRQRLTEPVLEALGLDFERAWRWAAIRAVRCSTKPNEMNDDGVHRSSWILKQCR
ncbi:MAG: hypothetical protein M3N97_01415 [Pseudomonadota bacterium]|nr:hypothetical protein [Pseudomonadota bacterium]